MRTAVSIFLIIAFVVSASFAFNLPFATSTKVVDGSHLKEKNSQINKPLAVGRLLAKDKEALLLEKEDGVKTLSMNNLKSCIYVYCAGAVFWECCPDKILPHDCFTKDNCGQVYCYC